MSKKMDKKEAQAAGKHRGVHKEAPQGQAVEDSGENKKVLKKHEGEIVQLSPEELLELKEKASERDKFLDLLQRTKADYLNYQKRTLREMDALKSAVLGEFISELLPVLDDFERAIDSAESNRNFDSLYEGVKLIDAKFRDVLKKYEVEPIEVVGQVFDPYLHEALLVEETDEYEDKTVIDEVQKGYKMPGRVLRPSRVKVARKKEKSEAKAARQQPQEKSSQTEAESDKEPAAERDGEASDETGKENK